VIAHNKLGTGKVIPVGKKAKESLSKRGYEVMDYIESEKNVFMKMQIE
jgi:F-type H+-transporting ATPase subunit gamma